MIKIYLEKKDNGKTITTTMNVAKGTSVLELLNDNEKTIYCLCKIGHVLKEINYVLSEKDDGKTISYIGLDNVQAGKAYEATLRFIIAMAFFTLYPTDDIRFSYNVSRSIFCKLKNPKAHMSQMTEPIIKEVKRIISLNLPIVRVTVSIEEAEEIYNKYSHLDKLDMLKYRPEHSVHLYKCGDYYDYMHGYMVPSTGCIKNYIIKPYSPGLIIQYPRYELNAQIPDFQEESTYGKTLMQAAKWGETAQLQTICQINDRIKENTNDFIQMCEAKHSRMLTQLGDAIYHDIDNIRLIAIAGPSSSGKTTFCNRLRVELLSRGINPVMISMDDYYLSKQQIAEKQGVSLENIDLEHVNCLDIELFNQHLYQLISGEEVVLPYFNFITGKREEGKVLKLGHNATIIIEGIHALNEKLTSSIPKFQKFKIYIAPQMQINIDDHTPVSTTDLRLIRRIVRDMKFRNSPARETIAMWPMVRDGEFQWIYPNQEGVDFVFNSELTYELAVMCDHALPTLKQIKPEDAEFIVANRLIKLLKYFTPITDESLIPCNSLIREFIGGSCYKL